MTKGLLVLFLVMVVSRKIYLKMASTGTISLSNASIGNISNVSVKINGDPTERFISFDSSSGVITFNSLDDGFRYNYILLIEFNDQRIVSAIFSHGCGDPVTTDAPITCTLPSSINILGNTSPEIQSQETYTLSITGGSNNTYSWAVIGGTISGSNTSNTVNVQWGTNTDIQSSVSVAVGCSGGDSITDTESFTLQNPVIVDCVIADSVSISGSNNVVAGSTVSYSATVTGGYNNNLSWSVIGGTIIGLSTGSLVSIQWGTDTISQSSVTVTASCLDQSVSDNYIVTIIEGNTTAPSTTQAATTTATPFVQLSISDVNFLSDAEACQSQIDTLLPVFRAEFSNLIVGTTLYTNSTLSSTYTPSSEINWYYLQDEFSVRYSVRVNFSGVITNISTCPSLTCVLPTSITINGNLSPTTNTTETYTLSIPNGQNYTYEWVAVNGVISGSFNSQSATVNWGVITNTESSITARVYCGGEFVSDVKTFTLQTLPSSCYVLYSAPFGGGTTTYVDEYGNNTSIVIPAQDEGLCFTICASSITNDPMGFVNKGVPCNSLDCNCNP